MSHCHVPHRRRSPFSFFRSLLHSRIACHVVHASRSFLTCNCKRSALTCAVAIGRKDCRRNRLMDGAGSGSSCLLSQESRSRFHTPSAPLVCASVNQLSGVPVQSGYCSWRNCVKTASYGASGCVDGAGGCNWAIVLTKAKRSRRSGWACLSHSICRCRCSRIVSIKAVFP